MFKCSKIAFAKNSCLNLKILFLYSNTIYIPMKSLKFSELENFEYEGGNIIRLSESNENEEEEDEDEDEDNEKNNNLIDFESLKKIKSLRIDISQFENYKNSPLESVEICTDYSFFKEEEKKMLEYLFSIKTLKKVEIQLDEINEEEIKEIEGESKSVEKLELSLNVNKTDYDFYNLQKKYPNLTSLEYKSKSSYAELLILEIIEDSRFKVNKLLISGQIYIRNKFYIESFESLKIISLNIYFTEIRNLEKVFLFLITIVKLSLSHFIFYYFADSDEIKKINLSDLYNLYI